MENNQVCTFLSTIKQPKVPGESQPYRKRGDIRQPLVVLVLGFLALTGVTGLRIFHEVHQSRLNQALIRAVIKNDTKSVLLLLDQGADANARMNTVPSTSLWLDLLDSLRGKHKPTASGRPVILLLTGGTNKGEWDSPPENTVIMRALLQHGASVNIADSYGFTPLMYAVKDRHSKSVQLLLHYGANPNVCDTDGLTPLMRAASDGYPDMVKILLESGAHIEATDTQGRTALIWATANFQKECVAVLLAHHANVNARDKDGNTPLSYAQVFIDPTIARLLSRAGARK